MLVQSGESTYKLKLVFWSVLCFLVHDLRGFNSDSVYTESMGAISCVYYYGKPEMYLNVQQYDKSTYLRIKEAPACRIHSTMIMPVFIKEERAGGWGADGIQRIVQNRGLDFGDVEILDFEFVRPENRELLPILKQEKFQFDTDLPDALGIIEKLKGIRPGDIVETEVVFPENWVPSTFKGLETIAIVSCHELFEWDLPELADDIVKSLNQPSLQSVADFRNSLLQAETGRHAKRLKDKIQHTLMQELMKIIDMEVSETALMETAKIRYQKMLLEYQAQGKIGPDALKQLTTEAMLHNFMISHKTEIENDQKAAAAMEAIFKDLKLSVSPEELETEVKGAEQEFEEMGEQYSLERLPELAKDVLSQLKVVEWFIKNGKVNIIPYSAQ
eukprot:g7968.t1